MRALDLSRIAKKVNGNAVLDDITFFVDEGEVVSLIGPNGAGKSTLMKIISHLVFPDSGNVKICGYDLATNTVEALSCISAMIEAPALYPQFTGKQHLEMVATLRNKSKEDVNRYIGLCDLKDKINYRVTKYSFGMKQRLYLAMALLAEPKLLILDEPTNGLDFSAVIEFREHIKSLSGKGCGILLSSHILSDLSKVSDKFVFINQGKILDIADNNAQLDIENLYVKSFGEF